MSEKSWRERWEDYSSRTTGDVRLHIPQDLNKMYDEYKDLMKKMTRIRRVAEENALRELPRDDNWIQVRQALREIASIAYNEN